MNKQQAGAIGGKSTSEAKKQAARVNGAKSSGRPKKIKEGK